jgi:hypothetical protein
VAITISVADINKDGTGINFAAYLKDFDKNFVNNVDRGGFSGVQSGNYASEDDPIQANAYAIVEKTTGGGQSVIFDGPGNFAYSGPFSYQGEQHVVYGKLSSITFGDNTKIKDLGQEQFLYSNKAEVTITGFDKGYMTSTIEGDLLGDLSNSDTSSLKAFLASDSINFKGSTGSDTFTGYGHADTLRGNGGNDKLNGAAGKDSIDGDKGNDTLTGGTGADTFFFSKNDGTDKITDFEEGKAGKDIIEFRHGVFDNYADLLAHAVEKSGNTIITYDGGRLTLVDVSLDDLVKSDFHIL